MRMFAPSDAGTPGLTFFRKHYALSCAGAGIAHLAPRLLTHGSKESPGIAPFRDLAHGGLVGVARGKPLHKRRVRPVRCPGESVRPQGFSQRAPAVHSQRRDEDYATEKIAFAIHGFADGQGVESLLSEEIDFLSGECQETQPQENRVH
jgi:hypothetical protein